MGYRNEGRVSGRYEKTRVQILSAFQQTGMEFTITGLAEQIPCAKIYIAFALHRMVDVGEIELGGVDQGYQFYRLRNPL